MNVSQSSGSEIGNVIPVQPQVNVSRQRGKSLRLDGQEKKANLLFRKSSVLFDSNLELHEEEHVSEPSSGERRARSASPRTSGLCGFTRRVSSAAKCLKNFLSPKSRQRNLVQEFNSSDEIPDSPLSAGHEPNRRVLRRAVRMAKLPSAFEDGEDQGPSDSRQGSRVLSRGSSRQDSRESNVVEAPRRRGIRQIMLNLATGTIRTDTVRSIGGPSSPSGSQGAETPHNVRNFRVIRAEEEGKKTFLNRCKRAINRLIEVESPAIVLKRFDTFDDKKILLETLIDSGMIDPDSLPGELSARDIGLRDIESGVTGSKFVLFRNEIVAILKAVGNVPFHLQKPMLKAVEKQLAVPENSAIDVEASLENLQPVISDILLSPDASLREGVPLHRMLCREKIGAIIGRNLGVPQTTIVKVPSYRRQRSSFDMCTLHRYVDNTQELRKLQRQKTLENLELQSAQDLAILDIRLINCDRHTGNVLIQKKDNNRLKVVPIDHGLVLSKTPRFYGLNFCWESWDILKDDLTEKSIHFLQNLNWSEDKDKIETELGGADQDALDLLCLMTFILKNIGHRPEIESMSPLALLKKVKEVEVELWNSSGEVDLLAAIRTLARKEFLTVEEYCEQELGPFCQI